MTSCLGGDGGRTPPRQKKEGKKERERMGRGRDEEGESGRERRERGKREKKEREERKIVLLPPLLAMKAISDVRRCEER